MKLRSYLRGIGIGVLVTAAVFIVSGYSSNKVPMTDAEIIARAKELGMIEDTVLSAVGDETKEELVAVAKPTIEVVEEVAPIEEELVMEEAEISKEEEVVAEPTVEVTPEPTPEPTPEITPEPTKEVKPVEDTKEVIIVVNSGDGSDTVARKLYEAGLVADAREYDLYLMANGYDRRITTGNHRIAVTASKEEIAKNLVSSTK